MPQATRNGVPLLWEEPGPGSARKLVIWVPGYTGDKAAMQPYRLAKGALWIASP
jgi:hypothetical protein